MGKASSKTKELRTAGPGFQTEFNTKQSSISKSARANLKCPRTQAGTERAQCQWHWQMPTMSQLGSALAIGRLPAGPALPLESAAGPKDLWAGGSS